MTATPLPIALLAELTHRCPLRCPYCANPLELARAREELDTETWCRVLREAASLGVLHVHFSGGEPTVRSDLDVLIEQASRAGLYSNLITSAVQLTERRVSALAEAGLDHVQISMQDSEPVAADRIAGVRHAHERKLAAARWVRAAGLPITMNLVVHRHNVDRLEAMLEMAISLSAQRIEVAHVQYHGWAWKNRAALLPTREQLERANEVVAAFRARGLGTVVIDYVIPDYYARTPKACMAGWGRRFVVVDPTGAVLPCHAAATILDLHFESVRDRSLADIWNSSEAFNRFRGVEWMGEPCRSCDRRELDWGGCRCQAMAFTGDANSPDPVCEKSARHRLVRDAREQAASHPQATLVYRGSRAARVDEWVPK